MARDEHLTAGRGYDLLVREELLERLAGGEKIKPISREEGMPGKSIIYKWIQNNEVFEIPGEYDENGAPALEADGVGFRDRLHAAMQTQAYLDMAEVRGIVRNEDRDMLDQADGSQKGNAVAVSRDKLIADHTLKVAERILSRFAPRQKLTTEEDGQDKPLGIAVPMKEPINDGGSST